MEPTDDNLLLRRYAEDHSDEAFTALVTRRVNLVYSVALRHVGNPQWAEEIAQAVFIILAKKAGQLRHEKALSSWLFQTTRLTANNFVRSEARRHRREQEAYMRTALKETGEDVWRQIGPLLDTAVAALGEKERRAIVLRFYEGRNLREVGVALRASEDTAKKRVTRALEKLRKFFARSGVRSTTTILAAAISANSIQAAPVGLAKTVSAVALAKGATAPISTLTLIKGALKIMAWTKAKTAVVVVAAAVLAAGTTTVAIKTLLPPAGFTVDNLDAKIARLNHPGATVQEVIQVLGKPARYFWDNRTLDKSHLPETYLMIYPQSVMVAVSRGMVMELRSEGEGRGFIWHGLRLGTSLDEALQILGPPTDTVVGKQPVDYFDGVLYKDMEGKKGYCYYSRPEQNLRLFFLNNRVTALYLTVNR